MLRRVLVPVVAVVVVAVVVVAALGVAGGSLVRAEFFPSSPEPGAVDVGFSQDMTVHHRQAVVMANTVRDFGTDPDVKLLAFDIGNGQLEQIGRMQGWLTVWGKPATTQGPHMTWVPADSGHSGHAAGPAPDGPAMPGMATEEELTTLKSLRGQELDIYFLRLMTRHHQGGAPMMRAGERYASTDMVRTFAANMLVTQTGDIELMTSMLTKRGSTPLPPPV
ncbi:DUF305 domain-containing protein [Lentzea sp. BCCO 10_0798]|uniref:DUF305 domain-containing protein n=1 Tax=Lentzea kristufekii TaxID=3095430 RepID=A0ABU4TJP8_9PSEU|nr:DUF305 domain-containing protein [Lentzea sp. BCCO 10_0798]MDX8048482.1 DUF305 domain-containing protein [Lentzea sp. BCCO 10_0798]